MRRIIGGSAAFLAFTGTILVLPVYAAPTPEAEPVSASTEVVDLGSEAAPADDAEVVEGTTEPVEGVAEEAPALTVRETDVGGFSLAGVTWAYDPAVTDVIVQLRVQDDDGAWGEWTEMEIEDAEQALDAESGAELRGGTSPLWTGESSGVEAELVTRSGAAPTDVALQLIDPGYSDADASPESPEITDTAEAASTMPAVFSRAQWGVDERIRTWDAEYASTIRAAALHHTADSNNYTAADVPRMLRGIYQFHTVGRGWGDIGYNVLVDKYGRLWEGRYGGLASTAIGAHTGGFNSGMFGVSMMGNYDQEKPPSVMIDAVANIMAWKFALYGVNPRGTATFTAGGGATSKYAAGQRVTLPAIIGHRDTGKTSCPGSYGYAQLDRIRGLVSQRLAAAAAHDPRGLVDRASSTPSGFLVSGWALDPDAPTAPIAVDVTVDGVSVGSPIANLARPDIAAAFPGAGSAHGFTWNGSLSDGRHEVCVRARNSAGPGSDSAIGCSTVNFSNSPPKYALDLFSEQPDGSVRLAGWAFDPDGTPTEIHVYVNGRGTAYGTGSPRPDVAAAFPAGGASSGFDISLRPSAGARQICVFVVDTAASGNNVLVSCKDIRYQAPIGSVDALAEAVNGGIRVRGWTFDPSVPTDVSRVHVYVDGRGTSIAADRPRSDIAVASPAAGAAHGYDTTIPVAPGVHQVCVYSINIGVAGSHTTLVCRSLTITYRAPQGVVDSVSTVVGGQVRLRGWMLDLSVPQAPITVHVYVDGRYRSAVTANGSRPDIAAALPGAGSAHGFDTSVTTGSGRHEVCVFAINVGAAGRNPLINCTRIGR